MIIVSWLEIHSKRIRTTSFIPWLPKKEAVASHRLCKLQVKLIQNRGARHALTPGIYFDARSWRMRALSEMDWWKRVGDH
jgi:hypothetical protein